MRITSIELERLSLPLEPPFEAAWDPVPRSAFPATIVRVGTDEGLVGIGSGDTMDGFEPYTELFLGRDPLSLATHSRVLETISFHAGRYWPLEAALWDLAGKALGVPVAKLLGGVLDRLPAYASLGSLRSASERVADAHALVEAGFRAVKVRIARERLDEGVAVVEAIRDAVGDRLAVMVDLNQWWRMPGDIAAALGPADVRRLAARLAELGVVWLEEPLPAFDLQSVFPLPVRIAGGEMARSFDELMRALPALDVVQPDVVLALGISGARTLADVALRMNRWFTPHTWTNGIGLLANLHVCCGVGGGPWIEYPYDPPGWTPGRRDFMLSEPVPVDAEGCVRLPSGPGLGVELDEEAVARWRMT